MTAQTLTVALGATVLALGAIPAPAPAQESPSQVVRFADLNLDSAQGAKAMFGRIKSAADEVCREEAVSDFSAFDEWQACVRATTDTAVDTLASPLVTALNGGRSANPVFLAKAH
jgi:UrcA family protein